MLMMVMKTMRFLSNKVESKNVTKKGFFNNQSSINNTSNNENSDHNNFMYHNSMHQTDKQFLSSGNNNFENMLLYSLNCDENVKNEFLRKENDIRDRAKSSYEMTNSLVIGEIKKIVNKINNEVKNNLKKKNKKI